MSNYLDEPSEIQRARILGTVIGEFLPPLWPLKRPQEEALQIMLNEVVTNIMNMQIVIDVWRRERPDV